MPDQTGQLPQFSIVGFSGHRRIADPGATGRAIAAALESLQGEIDHEWIALSSVAEGGDQLFVAQARRLGLSWHAILPLEASEFAKDFPEDEWAAVEKLLRDAEHRRIIAPYGVREDGYLDCGTDTVDGSDVLVAVWDGEPARGRGGTADVIAYARALNKPIILIDAHTHAIHSENFDNLPRHDRHLALLNRQPAPPYLPPSDDKVEGDVRSFMLRCDAAASRGAPMNRRITTAVVVFDLMAVAISVIHDTYDLHEPSWVLVKLLCLLAALGMAIVLRRSGYRGTWKRARLAAEFCRSALATWGLPRNIPLLQDIDLPELRGLARTLRILHIRSSAVREASMNEFRRAYSEKRIDDQLGYYRRQIGRADVALSRLKAAFWAASFASLACVAFTLAAGMRILPFPGIPSFARDSLNFLGIILPAAAATFLSLISINDLQRRSSRHHEMAALLETSRIEVEYSLTWNSLERIVVRTERALIDDLLQWTTPSNRGT